MTSSDPPRTRLADQLRSSLRSSLRSTLGSSWSRPAAVLILGALGLGYWSCATTQEPDPAAGSQVPATPDEPATEPASAIATTEEPDHPILLPVLNEEALTARVEAQRRLLGGNLFEDVRGRPVPWLTPQDDVPDDDVIAAADTEGSIDDALLDSLPGSSGLGSDATDPTDPKAAAAAGQPINGNALGLFVPLETEPAALAKFYGALEDLRQGRDTDGKVRVMIYGGSHTDADIYPQYIRSYLQQRFGDGGHGFVHLARPWRWYRHVDYRVEGAKYWITEHAQRRKGRDDGLYGLMGCSLAAKSRRAFGKVIPRGDAVGAEYEIYFLRQPKGGSFDLLADGKKLTTVKTHANEVGAGYHRFTLPEGQHEIEVKLDGKGEVRLFGMTIEREQPGVVVDTLGIGGTRAANMLRWDQATWSDNVAHRDPDLVVMFYGTNEATDEDQPIGVYERDLRSVLERIAVAAPHASCLIMGPGDFPRRGEDGTWQNRPRIDEIIDTQRRVAAEMSCAFWDTKAFMGGELSMPLWATAEPPMAKQDHIHFTKRGYVRIGMGVVDALMMGFDAADASADLGG